MKLIALLHTLIALAAAEVEPARILIFVGIVGSAQIEVPAEG